MPTVIKNDIIDLSSENKTEELANKIPKNLFDNSRNFVLMHIDVR